MKQMIMGGKLVAVFEMLKPIDEILAKKHLRSGLKWVIGYGIERVDVAEG